MSSDRPKNEHGINAPSHSKQIPSVEQTGSDGSQRQTSLTGDLLPPITKNRMPDGEFVGTVDRIVESKARGISSSDSSMLVLAKMRELEGANRVLAEKLERLTDERDNLRETLSNKNVDLEVERAEHANAVSQRRISAVVLVVAGILVSAAFSAGASAMEGSDYLMLVLGVLLYLVGIFLPAMSKKKVRT